MQNLFWLIPGKLAGRPGPDRAPWKLAALREAGIGAIRYHRAPAPEDEAYRTDN